MKIRRLRKKPGSRMEMRPKGGKYKLDKHSLSKEFQDGATKY